MSDGLERVRSALVGITFHREGALPYTMSGDDANVVIGILRIAGLKIMPQFPPQRTAEDISDKYYDTTDEQVSAVCRDWWLSSPPK